MKMTVIKIMLQKPKTVNNCSSTVDIILLCCYHLIFTVTVG